MSGCVTAKWERAHAQNMYDKKRYDYSLCSNGGGKLLIQTRPPSEQWMIDSYRITIIGVTEYIVSKHSDTFIQLCPGNYDIEIGATTGKNNTGSFRRKWKFNVDIIDDDVITYEYEGPYWMWSKGKLKKK